jgi:hypothetical protein
VGEIVDAFFGDVMREAASASDVPDASMPATYTGTVVETMTATDTVNWVTGFTPANLTGLIGWWDASVTASLSLTGADINSIADQSGNGQTMGFGSTSGSSKPTYSATGFNSRPAVMLDSTNSNSLIVMNFPMGTGVTLTAFVVCTAGDTSTQQYGRILAYNAPGAYDYNNVNSWVIQRNINSSTQLLVNRSIGITSSSISAHPAGHRLILTIDSAGVITLYSDGMVIAGPTTWSGNWITAGDLNLGRFEGNFITTGNHWTGPIAEWGVATGYSDATTVASLDTYLKTKWGL